MTSTLTTLDNLLKTLYLPNLREQVNYGVPLFSQLKRREDAVTGKNFTLGLHTAMNEGGGAAAENADLPDPGEEGYGVSVIPMRYVYWRFRLTGQTIAATRGNAGAFANALDENLKGVQKAMRRDINRQLFGTGSAQLCLVNGALTGTTAVVCDNGISATVGTTRRIRKDMVLDIWDAAGTTRQAQSVKVASVSSATAFALDQNVTCDDDAIVTRAGAKNAAGGLEMMGINLIADSAGALQSLNPATAGQEYWAAYEHAVGGAQTLAHMLKAVDGINTNSGEDPNLIVTTKGGRRAYFDLFATQIQFQPLTLKGGWRVLTFQAGSNDIPILVDDDCQTGYWYYLNTNHLPVLQMQDFAWFDRDGNVLRAVANKDGYEALLYIYANLGTDMRSAHGKQTGVTEG